MGLFSCGAAGCPARYCGALLDGDLVDLDGPHFGVSMTRIRRSPRSVGMVTASVGSASGLARRILTTPPAATVTVAAIVVGSLRSNCCDLSHNTFGRTRLLACRR